MSASVVDPQGTAVYLVRHGRTHLNADRRFRGRRHVPLDPVGRAEPRLAAQALADARLAAVFTSPLLRAVETAEAIARVARVGLFVQDGLIDLDYGDWEGLTGAEADRVDGTAYARFRDDPQRALVPSGETLPDVERRVVSSLGRIHARHPGAHVAVVSHEIPIRLVLTRLSGVRGAAFWETDVPTGSVNVLCVKDNGLAALDGVAVGELHDEGKGG